MNKREPWTRDQLLKVLSLYCQLPFGSMHSRTRAVITLAEAIQRTPSAVALKLVNFASLDPELRARGVGGMGNTSKADRAIWDEFYGKWDVLAEITSEEVAARDLLSEEERSLSVSNGTTEIIREVALRRGQSFFRAAVLAAYDGRCCITGITSKPLLRASHIVPWAQDPVLRLDPRNGLCLNALHDAAFDRGLITLTDKYELRVSARLKDEVPPDVYTEMFDRRVGAPIALPERFMPSQEMLDRHRSKVFVA